MSPIARPAPQQRPQIEARLHRMVQRWPEVSNCHLNPDPEVVEGIVGALAQSVLDTGYSYCPCRDRSGDPEHDRVLICPCAYHQNELVRDGHCKCVLFVSDAYDAKRAYTFHQESAQANDAAAITLKQLKVTVYLTRWCGQSRRTQRWIEVRRIPFVTIDIDQEDAAAALVRQYNDGNRSVPTLVLRFVVQEPSAAALERLLLAPEITLMACDAYITRWCSHSRRTLAWLREHEIAMRVIDIEADAAAAARLRAWHGGYQSVPTLDVHLRMTEPDPELLERILGARIE